MAASSDPRSVSPAGDPEVTNAGATSGAAHDAARTAAASSARTPADDRLLPGSRETGGDGGERGAAATGAAAGTVAGLQAGAVAGAMTFGIGALAGVALGAAAGMATGAALGDSTQGGQFTPDADTYYRALYEGAPVSGRSYDVVRAAYVFGHIAASEPGLAGQSFEAAEPALHEAWTDELRTRAGDWDSVRQYVHDAYGHARSEGFGERRDRSVVGSGGSAVDPVELDRARHGLSSVAGVADPTPGIS